MFKPWFYAACAAAGFALSFLTGLFFSGAGFVLVLVRALVFAVLFAGLSLAFHILLARFVPDLFEKDSAPTEAQVAEGGLDITIGDGEDASAEPDSSYPDFMMEREKSAFDEATVPHSGGVLGGEINLQGDISAIERGTAPSKAEGLSADEFSSEEGEEIDELPDLKAAGSRQASGARSHGGGAAQNASQGFAHSRSAGRGDNLFDSGADVETMAKAIRSVLSRG